MVLVHSSSQTNGRIRDERTGVLQRARQLGVSERPRPTTRLFEVRYEQVHALSSHGIGTDRRVEDDKSNYIINDDDDSTVNDNRKEEVYVISLEEASNASNYDNASKKGDTNETDKKSYDAGPYPPRNSTYYPDAWSISWYISSFGGLVLFFLFVSFSEWYCRSGNSTETPQDNEPPEMTNTSREGPPPPYHLFAPPSYDSINEKLTHIYVIPTNASTGAST
ncbi:hypothetical protein HN011_000554 [Eciton burchellii]|nr:hypothetical protein HN011_000554 [Eciton burchellii]